MLCTPMLDASTLWIHASAELYDECVIQLAYELLQVPQTEILVMPTTRGHRERLRAWTWLAR